jgi:hypothetical protein
MKQNIESLIGNGTVTTTPEAIAAAQTALDKERADAAVTQARQQLNAIANNTQGAVQRVRTSRREERRSLALLRAYVAAEEDYRKTGDYNAYNVAVNKANNDFQNYVG